MDKKQKKQENLDDTLEFLSLDDETIEAYGQKSRPVRSKKKVNSRRKRRELYEPEDDEDIDDIEEIDDDIDIEEIDEDFDIEEMEDIEEIDDEDYEEIDDEEDEDYEELDDEEDEDYEELDDDDFEELDDDDEDDDEDSEETSEEGNIFTRFAAYVADMSSLDRVVALFGCFILITAVITGCLYAGAKTKSGQVEAFAEIGTEIEGIGVIGESGLLAVSNAQSARLSQMIDVEQNEQEITENDEKDENTIEVGLNLTTIQSDIKIKFVNTKTNKLIGSVPFEVEVTGGKTFNLKDDDKDGIIYQTGIDAGTYTVKVNALQGEAYRKYSFPSQASTIKVTDTIAYKKVDIADEIKTESEVNAAAEDTAKHGDVESTLTDTVEWVESTKTEISSEESYNEIKKADIPDPSTLGKADGFMKFTDVEEPPADASEGPSDKEINEKKLEALNPTLSASSITIDMKKESSVSLAVSVSNGESHHIDWSSSDTSVAIVSDGVVTGMGIGSATITATVTVGDNSDTSASKKLTCTVIVTGDTTPEPTEPTNPTNPQETYNMQSVDGGGTIQVGQTCTVKGKTDPEGGTITWSSSDSKIATVDSKGVVTGVSVGTAYIKGTSNSGDYRECSITVVAAEVTYKSLTITGSSTIQVGKTGSVKGTTDPAGGTVTWKSDNEKVVKIDNNGNMTGVSAGTATITGTCGNVKDTWKVTVTTGASGDTKSKLKDKNGNQIYIKNADGKYVEATYADYYTSKNFYLKSKNATYFYTGWQTIDGYTYFFDKNGNYVTGEQVIQGARYTFGSDGRLSSGSGTLGIDVSKWNGSIDWNAVKNSGISYVIIRCGYRGSSTGALIEDPRFASNIQGAKAAGLKVGVYFFTQAVNEVEAVEEASMALNLVKNYGLNYPIFLDVESSGGRGDTINAATRTAVCKAFCATVQNSGYAAGIYANKTWLTSYINTGSLTGYKIWLAQYAAAPSYTATRYDMWQYSSKGTVKGISGNVDMNISYMNY